MQTMFWLNVKEGSLIAPWPLWPYRRKPSLDVVSIDGLLAASDPRFWRNSALRCEPQGTWRSLPPGTGGRPRKPSPNPNAKNTTTEAEILPRFRAPTPEINAAWRFRRFSSLRSPMCKPIPLYVRRCQAMSTRHALLTLLGLGKPVHVHEDEGAEGTTLGRLMQAAYKVWGLDCLGIPVKTM